jgi:hypothetical protein
MTWRFSTSTSFSLLDIHTKKNQRISFIWWPLHLFFKHAIFESLFEFFCSFILYFAFSFCFVIFENFHSKFHFAYYIHWKIFHFHHQLILHKNGGETKKNVNSTKIVSLDFNCLIYVMNIKLKLSKQFKYVQSKIIGFFSSSFHQVKNVKNLMNVTMCDKFLCKRGFGPTYDTTCQRISKCLIKNIDCKKNKKMHNEFF